MSDEGRALLEARKKARLSREKLAAMAGVSAQTIRRYEIGEREAPAEEFAAIISCIRSLPDDKTAPLSVAEAARALVEGLGVAWLDPLDVIDRVTALAREQQAGTEKRPDRASQGGDARRAQANGG